MTTFDWQQLGKPDFATVGQWFFRLDPEVREQFNRSEERTLIWAVFLAWVQGFRAGRPVNWLTFSEGWVGQQIGRSRWTIARAIETLVGAGMLEKVHRRPGPGGAWQTNGYLFCPRLFALLARIAAKSLKLLRVAKSPHKNLEKNLISGETPSSARAASPAAEENNDVGPINPAISAWLAEFKAKHGDV